MALRSSWDSFSFSLSTYCGRNRPPLVAGWSSTSASSETTLANSSAPGGRKLSSGKLAEKPMHWISPSWRTSGTITAP